MNERKIPWSIKGVSDDSREAARAAAEAEGLTVGAWLDLAIRNAAARELGAGDGVDAADLPPVETPRAPQQAGAAAPVAQDPLLAAIQGIARQIDEADSRARASVEPLAEAVSELRRRLDQIERGG